jgi:hypothetical protein
MNTQLEGSIERVNKLRDSQKELLKDNEDAFAEIVESLSVKQIEEMTDDEVLAFNNYEEGYCYVEEPDFETKEELVEYIRSVLIFLVQSYEYSIELEKEIEELNNITDEMNETIRTYFGVEENTSSVEIIEKAILDALDKAQETGDISKYNSVLSTLDTFNETFNLKRIKDLYKTLNPENLKLDASSDRSVTIYKNYLKVQQKLGSQYDLIKVANLEQRFLPEEYHELNNLFIIAVIKYISKSMKDGYYSSDTAFFVSQLTTNLFLLHLDKLPEQYKNILLENIKEFLDMFK